MSFNERAAKALVDDELRGNFRGAMDYLAQKRVDALPDDWQGLQARCTAIKHSALAQLPDLLEQLETNLQRNGIKVHWAEDAGQANDIIVGLLGDAKSVVKGKSMVTEEIGLNDYLEKHGIECLESDMGEYIVQLAQEHPSHIIMPAIHKNKRQVSELFAKHIPGFKPTEDVDVLIKAARQVLREKFRTADAGITGVNFAIAKTGTLVLVENEGNGRMSSTVPKMHIAVCGIEKVIPSLSELPPLLSLLTRSATGQAITTYINFISSPRKPDEKDGPEAVHLVLVDNGRSDAYQDEQFRKTLQCIRCGACMNHCPVYTRVGGHAYGTVYPGPIGKIVSPHLPGIDKTRDLPTASSLCGACEQVCPVAIPIPDLLRRLRTQAVQNQESFIWRLWAFIYTSPKRYRLFSWMLSRFRWLTPNKFKGRAMPKPAQRSLSEVLKDKERK